MWVFTKYGFFSAVETREDPDLIMLRSREKGHLEAIVKECNLKTKTSKGDAKPGHRFVERLGRTTTTDHASLGGISQVCMDCKMHLEFAHKTCLAWSNPVVPTPVITTLDSDYKYRIVIPRTEFCDLVSQLADEIDYANFKDAVYESQGKSKYEQALHSVWLTLYKTQR